MPVTINGTTGITDADGGTVISSADIASQAEAQAGTDNTKVMTPLRVAQVAIGVGQTWQNVTGSRALATTYTNTTGRPIQIIVSALSATSAASGSVQLLVDGVQLSAASTTEASGATWLSIWGVVTAIIPAGSTYRVNQTQSNLNSWFELR